MSADLSGRVISSKPRESMRVYGLDFTSKPTQSKRLTLAVCLLDGATLKVEKLKELVSKEDGDFSQFNDWLNGRGDWCEESEWIAGLDFPFGLPVPAIAHFGWLSPNGTQSWETWTANMYKELKTRPDFQSRIQTWKRTNKRNQQVKVHIKRQTDQIAGSAVSSPLKVWKDYPPVGDMFYVGARAIEQSGVSAYPVRITSSKRRIIEAYPTLVAIHFISARKYKDAKKAQRKEASKERENILNALAAKNRYGVCLSFKENRHRCAAIDDHKGDKLDSILCAVQAAWSVTHGYGIPTTFVDCFQQTVRLEGWIADPSLLSHFA